MKTLSDTSPAAVNVLVVDDVQKNLDAMRALLQPLGLTLLCAPSGTQALELLLQHDAALALLDVHMPGMDGYELAELMRGTPRTAHIPIIFITAAGEQAQRSFRGYEAGAVDFIHKPVEPQVLRSKVAVFADLYRQRRELANRVQQHERMSRANARMLSALTHDIRSPLAALAMNAELVIKRGENPALVQAGHRIKAALGVLGWQVDHLVNLAKLPDATVQPRIAHIDLATLARRCAAAASRERQREQAFEVSSTGNTEADVDADMVARALDHLLLQAATHGGEDKVMLDVDGEGRHAVVLRIRWAGVLADAVRDHLFGASLIVAGMERPRVGPGLDLAEQVARAHGGSVVGRSSERQGTVFELLLPRQTFA